MKTSFAFRQSGFGMLEVLISIFILMTGLLGLAGLLTRSQQAEMESYQRVQALVILQDMTDRLNANRKNAVSYKDATAGTGATPTCSGTLSIAQQDVCQWHNALLGASKKLGGSSSTDYLGAMIGARGCIFQDTANTSIYVISIAWQGMGDTVAPTEPADMSCGKDQYGDEKKRRVVFATVRIADLSAP